MAVTIQTTRKAVEISWDTGGGQTEPNPPDGFPTHPIYLPGEPTHPIVLPPPVDGEPSHPIFLPPYVDIGFPADQPYPDQGLPGDQPKPDQSLPGDQPKPDQSLPEEQPKPDQSLPEAQPHPDQSLPGPQPGSPGYPIVSHPIQLPDYVPPGEEPPVATPQSERLAVQVFAQGQEGDWSNTAIMPNDGLAVLTFPQDFKGESYVEVRALNGAVVDSGTIKVK